MVNVEGMESENGDIHHQVCSNCLLYNPALIPCPTCCLAMYCSEDCRTEAFNSYHRIECRVFRTIDVREYIVALRCLLVGTGQGAGLASLMKEINLHHILDVEAKIDESTEKPFSSDYMLLLRLCRKFHKPLSDNVDSISKIIIALRKAGYFDSVSDTLQREAHINAKDGNNDESVYEKDGDISSEVLNSLEIADESVDEEEVPDVGKNEDRQIVREYEDSSRIVGKEFIKKVTGHYCKLCNLCLCYNPEISQDEIVLAHCRTPLHVERCLTKNSEEQEITTQECVTETSSSENVILGTMAKKPQLDTPSKRRSRKKKTKPRSKSASDAKSDDTNEQKLEREAHIDAKDGKNDESVYEKDGDISSEVLDSVEIADDSVDEEEDPDVVKSEDSPIVQEREDSSRTVNGKEFVEEVPVYYCELCKLCLCYNQEMSEEEVLLAHSSTPLHLKRFSLRTTEGKDVNTQECVTETSVSKTAEEPPLDSTSQPPESSTEISTSPLDSLIPASNDANERNLVERQQSMTKMELFASFLLLNHIQAIDHATFELRKFGDNNYSSESYGLGVCILHAMLNHSCDPNVDFVTRGREMALYALRPISKGKQIFITYTIDSFAYQSLQERRELLFSLTNAFNCECVACVKKWPMFNDLLQMPRPNFVVSSKKAGIKAIQKITAPLSGKTADSTSRLEIIQVIGRLCDWLYTNVERPYAISTQCERLLIRAMKDFYDTSSLLEKTELCKNEILDCISNIASSIRIDLQHL